MAQVRTIQRPGRWDIPFGGGLTDAELQAVLSVPAFARMTEQRFPPHLPLEDLLRNDARILRREAGDVIYRQGEYGTSAYFVLAGSLTQFRDLPGDWLGRQTRSARHPIRNLMDLLRLPSHRESRPVSDYEVLRAQSKSVDEDWVPRVANFQQVLTHHSRAQIPDHSFVGDLEAMNRTPREHTLVVGEARTNLLEIRWQGWRDLLQLVPSLRTWFDERYRGHLPEVFRTLPQFANLTNKSMHRLVEATEALTFGDYDWSIPFKQKDVAEPVVVQQGDHAEHVYLIRAGFARVARDGQTVQVLGAGQLFGMDTFRNADVAFDASLTALGYAHVLQIPRHVLRQLPIEDSDAVAGSSLRINGEAQRAKAEPAPPSLKDGLLDFLTDRRFTNGTATMVIDLDRCTRCDDCVRACSKTHGNNPRFLRHGPVHERLMIANACLHCQDPVCLRGCPTGAINRETLGGQVVINDKTCIGCAACANACPYDAIRMVEISDDKGRPVVALDGAPVLQATKCDLCVDQRGGPACATACPHDALKRVDMRDLAKESTWLNR